MKQCMIERSVGFLAVRIVGVLIFGLEVGSQIIMLGIEVLNSRFRWTAIPLSMGNGMIY